MIESEHITERDSYQCVDISAYIAQGYSTTLGKNPGVKRRLVIDEIKERKEENKKERKEIRGLDYFWKISF